MIPPNQMGSLVIAGLLGVASAESHGSFGEYYGSFDAAPSSQGGFDSQGSFGLYGSFGASPAGGTAGGPLDDSLYGSFGSFGPAASASPTSTPTPLPTSTPTPTPTLPPTSLPTSAPLPVGKIRLTVIDDYFHGCAITTSSCGSLPASTTLCDATNDRGTCEFSELSSGGVNVSACVKEMVAGGQPAYCFDNSSFLQPELDLKSLDTPMMTILTTLVLEMSTADDTTPGAPAGRQFGQAGAYAAIAQAFGLEDVAFQHEDPVRRIQSHDGQTRTAAATHLGVLTQVHGMLVQLQQTIATTAGSSRRLGTEAGRRLAAFNVMASFSGIVAANAAAGTAAAPLDLTNVDVLADMADKAFDAAVAAGAINAHQKPSAATLLLIAQATAAVNEAVQTSIAEFKAAPAGTSPQSLQATIGTLSVVTQRVMAAQISGLIDGSIDATAFQTTTGDVAGMSTDAETLKTELATTAQAAAADACDPVCPWDVVTTAAPTTPVAETQPAPAAPAAEASTLPLLLGCIGGALALAAAVALLIQQKKKNAAGEHDMKNNHRMVKAKVRLLLPTSDSRHHDCEECDELPPPYTT
jgi:hypothetical protein